jgi:transglutaminase-like putative cysteine protease
MTRRYRIVHRTRYRYSAPVSHAHNEARLIPRRTQAQVCTARRVTIRPTPTTYRERDDFFGNPASYFAIQEPHTELVVTVTSRVALEPPATVSERAAAVPWEHARARRALEGESARPLDALAYTLDSPIVATSSRLRAYAEPSFPTARPLLEAVTDLMHRIHADFEYQPGFTTVATPLMEVLTHRRGVCQDFAHLGIGCLRSMGLPARYVSGYIETIPAPGTVKLIGTDASHAWFAVHCPGHGWVDYDPTNDQVADLQHVTVSWGRDFSDVTPLKGIVFGSGSHELDVSVDMSRMG